MIIAMIVAQPLLGQFDQAFQYIQEFTGFFTPGVCALFLMGIFWKQTTADGALAMALGSAALSIALKLFWPALPFIDRVGWCLFCASCWAWSYPGCKAPNRIRMLSSTAASTRIPAAASTWRQ